MASYIVESQVVGEQPITVEVENGSSTAAGRAYAVETDRVNRLWIVQTPDGQLPAIVECEPTGIVRVTVRGYTYTLRCYPARYAEMLQKIQRATRSEHSVVMLRAPMPGLVKTIHITNGATVRRGESIIVLEAMKMENLLRAPSTGIIRSINVQSGTAVEKGDVLCVIELDGQSDKHR